MSSAAAIAKPFITVEEYLEGEMISEVKHEYVDGEVYAMAGASKAHILLTGRLYIALSTKLAGSSCTPFFTDLKVRLNVRGRDVFYYPDVVVGCDPRDTDDYCLRFPKLIIEVLSRSTGRVDRHEKLANYPAIPTLEEYVLVDQEQPRVIIHRRRAEWVAEVTDGLESTIHLESVDLTLPLARLYEDVPGIAAFQ